LEITFDQQKRDITFKTRGLMFEDASIVFAGKTFEAQDRRKEYGEVRTISIGMLEGQWVVIGFTERDDSRHVFSM
jgi:uncharacterized protein